MAGAPDAALTIRASSDLEVLPRVLEILHAAFTLHDGRIDPPSGVHGEITSALAARFPTETLLLAERDGVVVGCIWCEPQGDDVYVGRLAVDPALHGGGAGRALLLASIDWARARGAARVTLSVRRELTENIAFFERHGFRIGRARAHPGYDRPTYYDMELVLVGREGGEP
jgi:ribosomal protein S18 acetylase RimI-like enzyme